MITANARETKALALSLVVAASLALFPMQAWGSCAWVLWFKQRGGPENWKGMSAFSTENECRKEAATEMAAERDKPKTEAFRFLCLPEHRRSARAEGERSMIAAIPACKN